MSNAYFTHCSDEFRTYIDYPGWVMLLFPVPLKAVETSLESFNEKLFS
jgi:hypothetical protein